MKKAAKNYPKRERKHIHTRKQDCEDIEELKKWRPKEK